MSNVNIKINGVDYVVDSKLSIMQACDLHGVAVPRFCYHELLPAVGNCRMCLVEIKNAPKLVPSCVTTVAENMEIITNNAKVDEGRKTVLEMILVNHPLDCPICDKGGECDLQDLTYRHGLDKSAINVPKRAVAKKEFGPLIDAYMTRCIHCTRCIRFATEIAGVEEIGGIGRGEHTEVTAYVNKTISSNLSGNIADVCPVGALTNSSYAYKARPWELITTNSIDIMDAVGSNIKVDSSLVSVLRILPRLNYSVNEEWLADKSRYIVDALRVQRLDTPMVKINNKLTPVLWDEALNSVVNALKNNNTNSSAIITGDFVDLETIFALKQLATELNISKIDCRTNNILFNPADPSSYLFNTKIENIDHADAILLVGTNLVNEAPIINARIRKKYLQGNTQIALIGQSAINLTYKYNYLGNDLALLNDILNEKHNFSQVLKQATNPMLILGLGALTNGNYNEIIEVCKQISEKFNLINNNWIGFSVVQTSTALVNGLALGFTGSNHLYGVNDIINEANLGNIKVLWLVGADNIDFSKISKDTFIIYQGHHGDEGAKHANVILPGSLWLEKDCTYINTEGRIQQANKAIANIGQSKEDWKIVKQIANMLNINLPFNTLQQLRENLFKAHPNLSGTFVNYNYTNCSNNAIINSVKSSNYISNYYITDIISKNSVKMHQIVKLLQTNTQNNTVGKNASSNI